MAEEIEGLDSGAQASSAGVDPAAVALALNATNADPSIAEDARKYLREQRALAADQRKLVQLQAKELAHELKLRHWSLWVRHVSGLLKLALELSAGLLLLFVLSAIGITVWNAAHADGLIIESFSVPPDMAAKGVTGQVVASQMLDQLTAMQNVTASVRPAKSYANNWGDDIKVEIPDTGMSVGEAYRFLRGWLGHETHISGEVTRTARGIAITARSGGDPSATFTGSEDDFGSLVQTAAEHVYSVTQPYRYAVYLLDYAASLGRPLRVAEGVAVLQKLTESSDPVERAYAWNGLSVVSKTKFSDLRAARLDSQNSFANAPDFSVGLSNLGDTEFFLGHAEAALSLRQMLLKKFATGTVSDLAANAVPRTRMLATQATALLLGDYAQAESLGRSGWNVDEGGIRNRQALIGNIPVALARRHDSVARAVFRQLPPPPLPMDRGPRSATGLEMEAGLENWHAVIALEPTVEETYLRFSAGWDTKTIFARELQPLVALAKAKLGDHAGAQQLISQTPGDCYDCIRIRGLIASEARQFGRADYWFARAINEGPSLPFAYNDWGQALLKRGQTDAAIEKFTLANQKGPHFADPLEGWGEALMAKNQSHLALAKFEEADKYAPNWGRLHLKWGEALYYAGRSDEAKVQFARTAELDLTPSEKAELAKVSHV